MSSRTDLVSSHALFDNLLICGISYNNVSHNTFSMFLNGYHDKI